MRVLVYKFGLGAPDVGRADVVDQIRRAGAYRNQLVEIERRRRAEVRAFELEADPVLAGLKQSVADAEAEVASAVSALKDQRRRASAPGANGGEAKPRRAETAEAKEALKCAREALKAAKKSLFAHKKARRMATSSLKTVMSAKGGAKEIPPEDLEAAKAAMASMEPSVLDRVRSELERSDAIEDAADAEGRRQRDASGLHWGTYQLLEAAARASFKNTPADEDPKFKRTRTWYRRQGDVHLPGAEGQIANHFQDGPTPFKDLLSGKKAVHIDPVDYSAWDVGPDGKRKPHGIRRRAAKTRLRMMVVNPKKSADGEAVWAEWPMTMHRPIPMDAVVKWVTVQARRVADREKWTCTLTVELPEDEPARASRPAFAAVEIGWRKMLGDIRVAVWRGSDGRSGELYLSSGACGDIAVTSGSGSQDAVKKQMVKLPDGRSVLRGHGHSPLLEDLQKADGIRRVRDQNLNSMLEELVPWLRTIQLPEWFKRRTVKRGAPMPTDAQALAYFSSWRSQAKFAALLGEWSKNRVPPGDDNGYALLEAWQHRDRHLWQYEAGRRERSLGRRRELYRIFAKELASRYGAVVLQKTDKRQFAKKPAVGEDYDNDHARRQRFLAAPSELQGAVRNAFAACGGTFFLRDPDGEASKCHACGGKAEFDRAADLEHRHRCGTTWDQDENTCRRLLQLCGGSGGSLDPAITRKAGESSQRESRSARVARMSDLKKARKSAAREADMQAP